MQLGTKADFRRLAQRQWWRLSLSRVRARRRRGDQPVAPTNATTRAYQSRAFWFNRRIQQAKAVKAGAGHQGVGVVNQHPASWRSARKAKVRSNTERTSHDRGHNANTQFTLYPHYESA